MTALPETLHWLFWDFDVDALDAEKDRRDILARVLERGRLQDVAWALGRYGESGFLEFFRKGHPAVSARTRRFWQLFLNAQHEPWPVPTRSPASSSAPWID